MIGPLPKPNKKIIIGEPPGGYHYSELNRQDIRAKGSISNLEKEVERMWAGFYTQDPNAFVSLQGIKEEKRRGATTFYATAVYYVYRGG